MTPLLIYLLIINAVGFLLMLIDKYKAKKNLWRIPESLLLGIASIGGSLGCIAGMHLARHKTKHLRFCLGLPLIFAAQCIILVLCLRLLIF